MRNNSAIRKHGHLVLAAAMVALAAYVYRRLTGVYFQQDEWVSQGLAFAGGPFVNISGQNFWYTLSGGGRPLGSVINHALLYYFPFDALLFAITAVGVHAINTLLLYLLAAALGLGALPAAAAAAFFAVSPVSDQAVTWFASVTTTLPAASFALLSVLLFRQYQRYGHGVYFWMSLAAAYTSLLFKESGLFLFLFLPAYALAAMRHGKTAVFSRIWPFLAALVFVVLVRYAVALPGLRSVKSFTVSRQSPAVRTAVNAVWYPFVGYAQTFVPQRYVYAAAGRFQRFLYPFMSREPKEQEAAELVTSDLVSAVGSAALLAAVCMVSVLSRGKRQWKVIRFGTAFMMASFLPYAVLVRGSSYLESRYYYVASAGAALCIGGLVGLLLDTASDKRAVRIPAYVLLAGISVYILMLMRITTGDVRLLAAVSNERSAIVRQIRSIPADSSPRIVYYVEGDSPGYYGLPQVKIPFQQGFGYTLMVLRYPGGHVPKQFLTDAFLWDIRSQGYREKNGLGFGYFSDKTSLLQFFSGPTTLPPDVIRAYRYQSGTQRLSDITDEIRSEVLRYETAHK